MVKVPSLSTRSRSFVSLFSGAGGLDLGLEQAGLRCAVCVENDPDAAETLRANGRRVIEADIAGVTAAEVRGYLSGEAPFAVVGGPPCQPFSNVGSKRGMPRGAPYSHFARLVRELQPLFLVFENVAGLKTRELDTVLAALKAIGYTTAHGILDAVDYGVAQHRESLIIIGVRGTSVAPWLPPPTHFQAHADPGQKWRTFEDATADLHQHTVLPFAPDMTKLSHLVPEGGNWCDLPEDTCPSFEASAGSKWGVYRQIWNDGPVPTLTTDPRQHLTTLTHPTEDRPLSLEEYGRLQGFPDSWKLSGGLADCYRQIGSAVPIPIGRAIGSALLAMANGVQPVRSKRTNLRDSAAVDRKRLAYWTPEPFWRPFFDLRGRIDLDPFSPNPPTVACIKFYTIEQDGFEQDWDGIVWLQPQYDRVSMRRFAKKVPAELASGRIELMAALLMNRSTPAWTQMLRATGAKIFHFTKGIKFGGLAIKAPFDSILAVWGATESELDQLSRTLPPNYRVDILQSNAKDA